jgi:hypothetical protein
MKLAWKQICKNNPDKEGDVKEALADGRNAFAFLAEIIEERIAAAYAESTREQYDIENWALKQADANGCIRTYKEILGLLQGIDK